MKRLRLTVGIAGIALIAVGAGMLLHLQGRQQLGEPGVRCVAGEGLRVTIQLPERVADYVSTNVEPTKLELEVLPKDTSFGRRLYRAPDGFEVLLSVVLMGTDRTSIHKPEYCLTSQGWQILNRETIAVPMERPHRYALPVRKFTAGRLVQEPGGQQARQGGLYFFWFVSQDHLTASHWSRVGWLTWDLVRRGILPRWAYVSAFVGCSPGQEARAAERAERFLEAAVPEFQTTVGPPPPAAAAP